MIMELCLMNRKRGGMNSWSYDMVASTDISLICKSCRSKSFTPVGDINETVNNNKQVGAIFFSQVATSYVLYISPRSSLR